MYDKLINKWPNRFLDLAVEVGTWSKDPSTKVGAVITTTENIVVSLGYNGFPRGTSDKEEIYLDRPRKYRRVIHAEKNAMMFAKRDINGCSLYVTLPPCSQCAAMIIQCGISKVGTFKPTNAQLDRWGDDIKESLQMFKEAGILYKEY